MMKGGTVVHAPEGDLLLSSPVQSPAARGPRAAGLTSPVLVLVPRPEGQPSAAGHSPDAVHVPAAARATAGRTCSCGHAKLAHEHYRRGTDCAICSCARYSRPFFSRWISPGR